MQCTSERYKRILRDPRHTKEVKIHVAGVEYGMDRIVSLVTSGGAFSTPDIGCCTARQIDLVLRRPGDIPRQAEIRAFVRLTLDGQVSEWLPKGVFFISTRAWDEESGVLTIHGFDAMLKACDTWLAPAYDFLPWPMYPSMAAADIAGRMGVELDPRTVLSDAFPVDYPVDENGDMTMMDVLEGIAVANAGNWVMSDEGRLLLLRLGDIPPETFYLVTEHGRAITLGGVRILVG